MTPDVDQDDNQATARLAVVAIGRNEGDRFRLCAESVARQVERFVYVDSGSTDQSIEVARDNGAVVVNLDTSIPFTAARARDRGFKRALEEWPDTQMVHFIDGDCEVVDGWLAQSAAHLLARPELGIVTGWRSERHRDATVYNMMCDVEWHAPAGSIVACGGDMLVRVDAYEKAGGFNDEVIAAEDDEFCLRVGAAGFGLERLPESMTLHDAAMTTLGQWWQRAVRAGHGYAQVGSLHPQHFAAERRRTLLWGLGFPLAALISLFVFPLLFVLIAALYGVQFVRTASNLLKQGLTKPDAAAMAGFLAMAKFPNLWGMAKFHWRRFRRKSFHIIEYK
ncbi:MAG: glycosyltransferase family A protein [Pseudomonadota bacterium]